ncbi:MAG TPA: hypothetical protein VNX67_01155 [Solirubrobacteraceae bacterium]|jgi:hypothetical protein|nr:hypothetical protein [Solirubrobacteraceae bacterium]
MTILTISIVWLAALAIVVFLLARRPERVPVSLERSPRLLEDSHANFDEAIETLLESEPATAKDVRDRAQQDLYVRP